MRVSKDALRRGFRSSGRHLVQTMKECPNYELVSPEHRERCDCGYNFLAGSVQPSKTKTIRRALRQVVKAITGIAAVVWLLTPITPWNGFVAFVTSSVVMLGCGVAWGLLARLRIHETPSTIGCSTLPNAPD